MGRFSWPFGRQIRSLQSLLTQSLLNLINESRPSSPIGDFVSRTALHVHFRELRLFLGYNIDGSNGYMDTVKFEEDVEQQLSLIPEETLFKLSTDVYDEINRRAANSLPFLPERNDLSLKRNQARQRLGDLQKNELQGLAKMIYFELWRRYFEQTKWSPRSAELPIHMKSSVEASREEIPLRPISQESSYSLEDSEGIEDPFSVQSTYCLDGKLIGRSAYPVGCGGYSDVWKGVLNGDPVAIKVLRGFAIKGSVEEKQRKAVKRLWREYLAWSSLCHPNIIKCLGFTHDFIHGIPHGVPALISPWMSHGTLLDYIEKYPDRDRVPFIKGLTEGLTYLHTRPLAIIHGDIRAGNILISEEGIPCLSDFGLSRTLGKDIISFTTSTNAAGSLRWMAPEIFENVKVNEATDVWAYGMTMLEIVTGLQPYADLSSEPLVLEAIFRGKFPQRPPNTVMGESLWEICQECWRLDSRKRPTIMTLRNALQDTFMRPT